ncbi:MAG: lysophospholipid acyltransferase family protein [Bacteroidales bacterium]|nr:lysophospholipid acyltransferase family protein [Bacteroidales bacterium]MBN2763664.1 lysophospholipid acyltransferase family protein [Bacteroidales bacterium]
MIIKAHHHFIVYPFFKIYTLISIRRNFHEVKIIGEATEKNLPMLVVANHFSWWDGIFVNYVNMKKFKRRFYFMMLEEQLQIYSFFRKLGGYSVRKHSRTMIESLRYTQELLSKKSNMVLIFPQGAIQSLYHSTLIFEQGIERIVNNLSNEIQLVFIVNLIDYFSHPKPTLYIYLKEYRLNGENLSEMQDSYNAFLQECIEANKKIVDTP